MFLIDKFTIEEVAYSNFAFYHSNLTFLIFPGLTYTEQFIASPGRGVYALEHVDKRLLDVTLEANESTNPAFRSSINAMLDRHEAEWKPSPTFSSDVVEYPIELREGAWEQWVWFDKHYTVDFVRNHSKISGHGRR
jgi:hypothetical protein